MSIHSILTQIVNLDMLSIKKTYDLLNEYIYFFKACLGNAIVLNVEERVLFLRCLQMMDVLTSVIDDEYESFVDIKKIHHVIDGFTSIQSTQAKQQQCIADFVAAESNHATLKYTPTNFLQFQGTMQMLVCKQNTLILQTLNEGLAVFLDNVILFFSHCTNTRQTRSNIFKLLRNIAH